MSLAVALARIDQIEHSLDPPQTAASSSTTSPASAPLAVAASAGVAPSSFSNVLENVMAPGTGTGAVPPVVAAAEGEVGQAEQPPGSNDSPRIAAYRQATAGSAVGPWCAYFVSWAARQAGTPLGDQGQGFGSVDALSAWAQRSGRAIANGPGVVPRAGDLIVFHEHVGIVEAVLPDGRIQTIEGNSSDRVSRNVHAASDALEYIRMI
jgi:hypothetical protein